MRKALAESLVELISKDKKIIFLTGDLGFGVFDELQKKYPDNYLNVGIAESNMVALAAGLKSKGFKPIVYSIASFVTSRPYEFIKILAGYNSLPIIFIGAGGGLTYSTSGSTHHSLDDLSLMLGIPEIEVFSPAGPKELKQSLELAIGLEQTSYIRIGKFGEKDVLDFEYSSSPVKIVNGGEIAIFSHGNTSLECLKVALEFNFEKGEKVAHFHFPFLQNIDWNKVYSEIENIKNVVVVEESWPIGSLHSKLLHSGKFNKVQVHRLGPPFKFIAEHDEHVNLQNKLGYSSDAIKEFIKQL
jgi:transketolase